MRKLNSYSKRAGRNRSKLKKVSLDRFRITVFKSSKNIRLFKFAFFGLHRSEIKGD